MSSWSTSSVLDGTGQPAAELNPERKPRMIQGNETQREAHPFSERGTYFGTQAGCRATAATTDAGQAGAAAAGTQGE